MQIDKNRHNRMKTT